MRKYEFKIVPVPARCGKVARGSGEDPVSHTLEVTINAIGVEGWEFFRMESVSMGGRGLFGRRRERDVLVFRRERPVMAKRPSDLRETRAEPVIALEAPHADEAPKADKATSASGRHVYAPRRPRPELPAFA